MNEFMDEGGYEEDIDSVSVPLNFAMGGPVEAMHLSPYTPTNQESGDYQDSHSMPQTYAYGGEVEFGDYSRQRPPSGNARQMLQRFADGGVVSRETGSPFNLNPFGPGAGVPDAAFRGSSAYSQLPVVTPSSTPLTVPQETASMFQQKAGITPSAQQLQYWSGVFGADNQVTPDEVARFDQALLNTGKTPMAYVPNSTVELQDRFGPMSMMTGGTGTGASWQAPTVTTRPPTLINPDMSKLSASQQYARDLAAQDAITAKTRSQITDLYTNTLKRDPDRAGMDYWMRTIGADNVITPEEIAKFNAAAQGELSKSTVTGGTGNDTVSGGTVNQQGVVNAVNNAVNAGGTMGAEKATTAGTTAAPVFEYFNNTPEQNAKIREMLTGENDYARGQLMELYAETFGRVPDTAGFNYWLNTIGKDNILTKDEIAQWNANAQKELAQMDQLKGLYGKYLQREPDDAGRAYWMGQIAAAGGVNSGIESLFQQGANQEVSMGNAGYRPGLYSQMGSRETPEAVALLEAQAPFRFGPNDYARSQLLELYTDVLGRPVPDEEGFNWWLQNYGSDNRISKEEENLFIEAAQRELNARKMAKGGPVKKADGGEDLTPVVRQSGSPEYGEIAIGGGVTPDTKTALTTKQGFSGKEAMDFVKRVYGEGASNLESAVRGSVAAIPGSFGDIESIFRDDKNRKLATTEEILRDRMPKRVTAPTKEAAGFEEVGTYLPLPIPAGTVTQAAKTAGKGVETGAAKMLEKLGPRQGRKWESVIASMEPARSYAVKPKGGTFYPPESGSNLDDYLNNTVQGLSRAPNLSGKDAKVVAQFIRDKGRKYLTTVYGTADDPLRQALMEGRLPRYDSDKERFRGYALDAARAGNPEAVEDLEKAYDNATRLQTLGYMSPSSTENTFTIGNRMDEAVRQKLLAEGVPEELINTSYPTTQSSEAMRGAYSDARKKLGQLLGAMEQASPAAFDTEGKLRQAFIRGIGESDKGNEALLYAATKEEPIYDISGPSMDYMKADNLAKAIASIPVNELERMTFPEAVVKGTQNMKFEKDWQLSVQKARDGKPVPKEIYFRGTEPVYKIGKNLQWVRVMSPDAVELEGAAMRHSIGGYKTSTNYNLGGKDAFNSGLARVYSLRDEKGVPQVTVEAKFTDNDGLEIRQIRSKFNSEPTQEEKSAVYQLFDTLGPREIRSTNYLTDRAGKDLKDSVTVNWGDLYKSYSDYKGQAQGFSKGGVVKKAADMLKSLGAKEEKLASKDLTTLQDFSTSLGDRIRERVASKEKMMNAMEFKYAPGQRVFTADSAKKNFLPFEILAKRLYGDQPVRETPISKASRDPQTGKVLRTPYEPGYLVRHDHGNGEFSEYVLPESAIKGAVDNFAKGGAAKKASTTAFIKTANARL